MGVHAKGYGQTLNANTMANAQPQYPQVVPGSAMPMAVRRGADPLFPRLPLNSKPQPCTWDPANPSSHPELSRRASHRHTNQQSYQLLTLSPRPPLFTTYFSQVNQVGVAGVYQEEAYCGPITCLIGVFIFPFVCCCPCDK